MRLKILLCTGLLVACGTEKKSDANTKEETVMPYAPEILNLTTIDGLDNHKAKVRSDLKPIFCQHVYLLPLKSDFDKELGYLCEDGKPSAGLNNLDLAASAVGDDPKPIEISTEHEGEYTTGFYAVAYHVPVPPKWVRNSSIPYFMMTDAEYGEVTVDGEVDQDLTASIGGDLQFGKYNLSYATDVATPDDKPFANSRKTEFNAYQVHGGNPDIGIGTEHLTDDSNADFEFFNGITVTIGTEGGGSLLITLIRSKVRNNGYEDLARKAFAYTTYAQGTSVRAGILKQMAHRIIEE